MNKKFISKAIALVLASSITLTAISSPSKVYSIDSEVVINENLYLKSSDKDYLLNILKEMANSFGSSVFEIKGEGYILVIDSNSGDITHKFYDSTGTLINSYTTNYYDNLKNMVEDVAVPHGSNTITTNTIPLRLNSLHYTIDEYTSGQKLYVQNSKNRSKSYYLKGKYTSNRDVMNFINAVDDTASKANRLIGKIGSTAAIGIASILGIAGRVTINAVIAALEALGFTNLVGGAVAVTDMYNDYLDATRQADHRFDAL